MPCYKYNSKILFIKLGFRCIFNRYLCQEPGYE